MPRLLVRTLLLLTLASCGSDRRKPVAIQPVGAFPVRLADSVEAAIRHCYGLGVVRLPERALPAAFFSQEKGPRYCADSLLPWLRRPLPDSLGRVLGLTAADLYTSKRDEQGRLLAPASRYANWGIFGLGERPGRSCVASVARLGKGGERMLYERTVKVSLHEVGHTLGLPHCPDRHCVMTSAAEKLSTVDGAGRALCADCRHRAGLPY